GGKRDAQRVAAELTVRGQTRTGGRTVAHPSRTNSESGVPLDRVTVASNPEFLREGAAVRDFLNPDRIVIGCDDPSAAGRISDLYAAVRAPVLVTDPASAEMIKYASNAFLATRISFINAVANLCEAVDADVREVALGMGYDRRIGFEFLYPGPGYGGSCFPKDIAALRHIATEAGYDFGLLGAVQNVNRVQHDRIVEKIARASGGDVDSLRVAFWGLTFKADTDDLRDSPALVIAQKLLEQGAKVRAYDPAVPADSDKVSQLEVSADPYEACEGAQVLAVLTEWDEFRWLDFDRVRGLMATPAVVDARNLLDPAMLRRMGFTYAGIGR
ncbi:MAG: UDP-glucose dehydrogenase family protein, partial [Acidimicrobiia bacterium]